MANFFANSFNSFNSFPGEVLLSECIPAARAIRGAIENPLVVLYDRFLMDDQNRSYLINLINLSIYPSIHQSIYLSIHPSIHPSIHLSIDLSLYLSLYFILYIVYMYVWNRNQISRSIWLSLNLTLSYSIIYINIIWFNLIHSYLILSQSNPPMCVSMCLCICVSI